MSMMQELINQIAGNVIQTFLAVIYRYSWEKTISKICKYKTEKNCSKRLCKSSRTNL